MPNCVAKRQAVLEEITDRQKRTELFYIYRYCPYGNIINFSHTRWIHFSANNTSCRWIEFAQTHRHTKLKTVCPPDSLCSLGGYNDSKLTAKCSQSTPRASHVGHCTISPPMSVLRAQAVFLWEHNHRQTNAQTQLNDYTPARHGSVFLCFFVLFFLWAKCLK